MTDVNKKENTTATFILLSNRNFFQYLVLTFRNNMCTMSCSSQAASFDILFLTHKSAGTQLYLSGASMETPVEGKVIAGSKNFSELYMKIKI